MQSFWVDYLFALDAKVEKIEDWSRLPVHPLVSVAMITFNHEPFIAKALDGILMQEVDFDYEVVIGEDHSTDRTREIVEEYQNRHPDKIRLRLARENLYSQGLKPGIGVSAACRGKYIAILEGDDYWTDPKKLQKQVNILETEPDVALVHTNVMVQPQDASGGAYAFYGETDLSLPLRNPWPGEKTQLRDLAQRNFISTCSVMYRAWSMVELPTWFKDLPFGDYALWLLTAKRGAIRCMTDITGVYRQHVGGVMSGVGQIEQLRKMYSIKISLIHAGCLDDVRGLLKASLRRQRTVAAGFLTNEIVRAGGWSKDAKVYWHNLCRELEISKIESIRVKGEALHYAFQRFVGSSRYCDASGLITHRLLSDIELISSWKEIRNAIYVFWMRQKQVTK